MFFAVYEYDRKTRKMTLTHYQYYATANVLTSEPVFKVCAGVFAVIIGWLLFFFFTSHTKESLSAFTLLSAIGGLFLAGMTIETHEYSKEVSKERPEDFDDICIGVALDTHKYLLSAGTKLFFDNDKITIWHGGETPVIKFGKTFHYMFPGKKLGDSCPSIDSTINLDELKEEISDILNNAVYPSVYFPRKKYVTVLNQLEQLKNVLEKHFGVSHG